MSKDKQVTIITTLRHNPGDDFVRSGIEFLLGKVITAGNFHYIHKHVPSSVNPLVQRIYLSSPYQALPEGRVRKASDRLLSLADYRSRKDFIAKADILVQSGAPVYWYHGRENTCARNEWYGPLIRKRARLRGDLPVLNLGAGACQGYYSDGQEFAECPEALAYAREFFDICSLTTVRDQLSLAILQMAERQAEVLPCPSVFARQKESIDASEPEFIALNFMPMGGHFQFTEGIRPENWLKVFRECVDRLKVRYPCLMVCHSTRELRAARSHFPDLESFYSRNYVDYLKVYSRARWGILNRVHGAFAMASFGRPALVVGSDSRARMAELLNLPCCFVGEVSLEYLLSMADELEMRSSDYPEEAASILSRAEDRYCDLLRDSI